MVNVYNTTNKYFLLDEKQLKWNSHKLVEIGKKRIFYGIEQSEAIPGNTV